jgi:transcriptional regulator with XRE-family HTH domain
MLSMPKAPPEPKTEGQRQLLELEGSEQDIATKMGCSRATAGHWRRGRRTPGEGARHKLELLFGIPQRAWDVSPGQLAAPPPPEPDTMSRNDDTLDITKQQVLEIRRSLVENGLAAETRAKLRAELGKLLALRARLELAQELREDRMVREHPEWARVKAAILKALEPYPEAAAAVAEALP